MASEAPSVSSEGARRRPSRRAPRSAVPLRIAPRRGAVRPARASSGWRSSSSSRWSIIVVVSLGDARRDRPHHARRPDPRQLRPGDPARSTLPAFCELAALRGDHDGPVDRSSATRSRTGSRATAGRRKILLLDPRDAAVLDELPHPDLRLDDHPARQRRPELDPPGASASDRATRSSCSTPTSRVVLGMTYGFLPFAILPLYVSIDRLDPNLVQAAPRPVRQRPQAFLHVTLPLTMPGHHRGRAADVHPGDRRLRDARTSSAAPRRRRSPRSSRSSSRAGATGRTARRSGSC